MNGTAVEWDGGVKLSSTGLGKDGLDKATYLTNPEESIVKTVAVDWASLDTLGIRATSTSTAGGSIKGVDTEPEITPAPPPGPPKISISDTSVVEGGSPTTDGKFATFNVTMDHAVDQDMLIFFHTSNGSAVGSFSVPTPGVDNADYFPLTSGFFAIMPAGETSTPIDIPLWDDHIVENPETFTVTLTGTTYPGATIVDAVGVATIIDDDTPISSALNDTLLLT